MKTTYIFIILIIIFIKNASVSSNSETSTTATTETSATPIMESTDTQLNYKETDWPELCKSGRSQSPIDLPNINSPEVKISDSSLIQILKTQYTSLQGLMFNNYDNEKFHVNMTGMGNIIVVKNNITYSYDIIDIDIHFNSEHTFDLLNFDMEMHFVHRKNKQYLIDNNVLVDPDPNSLLIVGIMWMAAPNVLNIDIQKLNFGYGPILALDINHYFLSTRNFYHYSGSLTTPDCSEIVNWVVMDHVEYMGITQLEGLKEPVIKVYPDGNSRVTKPVYGRSIYYVRNNSEIIRVSNFVLFITLFISFIRI